MVLDIKDIPKDFNSFEYTFKAKDNVEKFPELLKEPMEAMYKELEDMEIWNGYIDCVSIYPEGNRWEYKFVAWVK